VKPVLWFVTPVYKRFHLTKVCLEQRARMIERLPFKAQCVVVGDDENLDVARDLGLEVVEKDNTYIGRKFNAGYLHAVQHGATHCMPIGSDSWLHEDVFQSAKFTKRGGISIVGLSSFSPNGLERADMAIKYPAGFGVGMIYPAHAVAAENLGGKAADPKRQRGIDNSTWERVGKGKVRLKFLEYQPYLYINFHSTEDSITDFRLLRKAKNRVRVYDDQDPFGPLLDLYDHDLIEDLKTLYALRSLQVFLTGEEPQFYSEKQPMTRRRYPYIQNRPVPVGYLNDAKPSRYPNVGLRGTSGSKITMQPRDYEAIKNRKRKKRLGIPMDRDEELALRFDEARGF
jgi:hypothetical protein